MNSILRLSAYCLLLLFAAGCVTRSLTIRSEPPGALVYVDDELKGRSPVSYDFMWYGWHRITLRKEGYERLDDHKLLRSPVYLWIPFDVVMELIPFRIHDTRTWAYALTPSPALPTPVPPVIEPSANATPPSTPSNTAPPGSAQAAPSAATGAVNSSAVSPTQPATSSTTTPPPAKPPAAEPTTEPTHGTR